MERKAALGTTLTLLLLIGMLTVTFNTTLVEGGPSTTTTIYVNPATITATAIGQAFTVEIRIDDIINLWAGQIGLTWDPNLLEINTSGPHYGFQFGPFWGTPMVDYMSFPGIINNTAGEIYPAYGVTRLYTAINGSGILAYVDLASKATGVSNVHLAQIGLKDRNKNLIPIDLIDVFTVIWEENPYHVVNIHNLTGTPPPPTRVRNTNYAFNHPAGEISFNATGPDGASIFCNVTIPKSLLDGEPQPWEVKLDGADIPFTKTENTTHTSIYFTLTLSTHKIQIIKVPPDTEPPNADAGPDQTVDEDTIVTFDGSGSTDNVGIVNYTWTFTDVTPQTLTGVSPTYTFATPGIYAVTLNVSDAAENWDTDAVTITVLDVTPPVADAGSDQSVYKGMTVTFDGSGSTDNVGVVSYVWTFTDVTPQTLTGVNPGYTFNNVGDFEVTLNVTDAAGNWDTDTMWVHVSPDLTPPVADAGPDQSVAQGTLVTFDGSGSTDNVGIVSYVWAFTDVTPQTLTGVNPGYTFNNVGDFEVTLNVSDAAGNWDTDTTWVYVMQPRDVAVTDVTDFDSDHGQLGVNWGGPGGGPPLTPVKWAHQTWDIEIDVTVQNQGSVTATFNVTVFYGNSTGNYTIGIAPAYYTVTLAPGNPTTVTFTWNPPKCSTQQTYTIYAEAVILGDVNPEDNTMRGNDITVMLIGDTDADGDCDLTDLINFGALWSSLTMNAPQYWPWADFNNNGEAELNDLIDFGKAWFGGPFPAP